jgi:NTE family protein
VITSHLGESRPRRHRLAVVLSGGAAVGAFQVGVLDTLARRAVVPDLIVGTSIGAIDGAFWAFNPGR